MPALAFISLKSASERACLRLGPRSHAMMPRHTPPLFFKITPRYSRLMPAAALYYFTITTNTITIDRHCSN